MAGGAVTSGLGLSGLNPTVGGLDAAIGELGIECVEPTFRTKLVAFTRFIQGHRSQRR